MSLYSEGVQIKRGAGEKMTGEVLGFRLKEIVAQNKASYVIDKETLVPVVSLEEYTRFIEEANAVILRKNKRIMELEEKPKRLREAKKNGNKERPYNCNKN